MLMYLVTFALASLEATAMKNPCSARAVTPNPSVKLSAIGRPPSPSHRYGVHFLWLGLGVLPLAPAYLER